MEADYTDVAQKSYDAWNTACFNGELPNIDEDAFDGLSVFAKDLSCETKSAGGYLDDAAELGCFGKAIYINTASITDAINDDYYRHQYGNPYRLIADVMLHEMVHLWCDLHGIYDVDSSGMHTVDFKRAARIHMVECEEGSEGFNRTHASADAWSAFYQVMDKSLKELMRN